MRSTGSRPALCTKFAPLPWRQTPGSLVGACRKSLARLGVDQVDLYIQHWPGFFLNALSNDAFLEGLAQVHELGLAKEVGASNFNAQASPGRHVAGRAGGVCGAGRAGRRAGRARAGCPRAHATG